MRADSSQNTVAGALLIALLTVSAAALAQDAPGDRLLAEEGRLIRLGRDIRSGTPEQKERALDLVIEIGAIRLMPEVLEAIEDPTPLPRRGDTGWGFVGHQAATAMWRFAQVIEAFDLKEQGEHAYSFSRDSGDGGAKLKANGRLAEVRKNWEKWWQDRRSRLQSAPAPAAPSARAAAPATAPAAEGKPAIVFDNHPANGLPPEAVAQERIDPNSQGKLAELIGDSIETVHVRHYSSDPWKSENEVRAYLSGLLKDGRAELYSFSIWSQGVGEPEIECLIDFTGEHRRNAGTQTYQGRLLVWETVACFRDATGKWWFVTLFDYYHAAHPSGNRKTTRDN